MLVARLIGLATAVALAVCVALYLVTGERRYVRIGWRIFTVALVALVLFLLLLFGERLVNDL